MTNLNELNDFTIRDLISKSLEGSITRDEMAKLDALIIANPQARRYYVEYLHLHLALRQIFETNPEAVSLGTDMVELYSELSPFGHVPVAQSYKKANRSDFQELNRLMQMLAEEEEKSPVKVIEKQPEFHQLDKLDRPSVQKTVNKFFLWTTFVSLAALLAVVVYFNLPLFNPVEVATMTDSIHAEYASEAFVNGSRLTNRSGRYYLQDGISSIQFDSGANVVIEGPAEFQLKSMDKMVLFSGRLFAKVPRQAIGFTVETLDSSIIDLGTEFGVYAVPMQGTELHVFEGKTQMALLGHNSMLVSEGQAQRIDTATGRIQAISLKNGEFIQKINSDTNLVWNGKCVISLSDLVMGGDGYGSSSNVVANFDPITGNAVAYLNGQHETPTNDYRTIESTPFLDGIFVPNGNNQVVSSEGHVFVECPETSGMSYHGVGFDKNCRYFPQIHEQYRANRHLDLFESAIYMHSNVGVTIDINAVRHTFPGQKVLRFRTSVGTAFSSSAYGQFTSIYEAAPVYTDFDVWIVMDGRLQKKIEKVRSDSLLDIDVPVTSADRFLTIIVTDGHSVHADGSQANHYDLCAMADPRFEVECME